jgi:two-component system LytT family response regulator
MKISCHIIEDEPMASKLLQMYVSKMPVLELTAVSDNPIRALDLLKSHPVDLLFLDIRLPEMTGLALIGVLQYKPLVILTTAFSEFAVESYDLDVVDYLKKPITFDRFVKAIDKVEQRLQLSGVHKERSIVVDYIFVKEGTRILRVNIDDILFIEGLKNYVSIHTRTQKIVSLQRLKALEEQLPANQFIRVHNSYIVAKAAISSIKENEISIGVEKIPIGETYLKAFMDFIDGRRLY